MTLPLTLIDNASCSQTLKLQGFFSTVGLCSICVSFLFEKKSICLPIVIRSLGGLGFSLFSWDGETEQWGGETEQ